MNFLAMDVETANGDTGSICSIGIARFEGGVLAGEFYSLVDPRDDFYAFNIGIHGITPEMVRGAPTYEELAPELNLMLEGAVVATHTAFDRVATERASARWRVAEPECRWLDSARMARRTWAHCARRGFGLAPLAAMIGYRFEHHHALEDAKAAGHVVLAALAESGRGIEEWLALQAAPSAPIRSRRREDVRRLGDPTGPLSGQVVVFTGTLSIARKAAADLAARAGCAVDSSVSPRTTFLVVGADEGGKSSKQLRAEAMAAQGHAIRIIDEDGFRALLAQT